MSGYVPNRRGWDICAILLRKHNLLDIYSNKVRGVEIQFYLYLHIKRKRKFNMTPVFCEYLNDKTTFFCWLDDCDGFVMFDP